MRKTNALLTLLAFTLALFFTSCGGSSSKDNPIVGTWTITKAEGMAAASNQGVKYVFKDDGKATVGSGMMQSEYTYTISGDTLKMDFQGAGNIVLTWIYKIDGNKMTLDNASDADQKFWLEK